VDNYRAELALSKTIGRQSLLDTMQHAVDKFNDAKIVRNYKVWSEGMQKATDIGATEKCALPDSVLVPTCRWRRLEIETYGYILYRAIACQLKKN